MSGVEVGWVGGGWWVRGLGLGLTPHAFCVLGGGGSDRGISVSVGVCVCVAW